MKVHTIAIVAGAGAVALVLLYIAKKGFAGAAAGAVGAAADAAAGTVLGIGDVIGIPRTDETECERAKREGRTWDASFACPASDWLGHVFGSSSSSSADADETERLARRYPAPAPPTTYSAGDDFGGTFGYGMP
jgi:hypothetical protein